MSWWALGLLLLAPSFTVLWLVQRKTGDASLVDAGWAAGLALMGVVCAATGEGDADRRALVMAMALLWGGRLATHLYLDRVKGKAEDGRYAELRRKWGEDAQRNFLGWFLLQGALDVLLALPFAALCASDAPLGAADWAGAALLVLAVAGESVADKQLAAFRADPRNKGKTCRGGLWRYSRHPNYFFEWLHWLSYALMMPADWRMWTSPALMLYCLLRVTGIPYTEAQALRSRGDDYRRYQRETSMFFPWFPKGAA